MEKSPTRVEDLRRYFNADGLHQTTREYRRKFLGDIKSSFVYYELDSSNGKVLTEYDVDDLEQRTATQSFRRYRLTDTGVHLLSSQAQDSSAKVSSDLVFSWSPQARPFAAYELEATAKGSLGLVMPLEVTAREKTAAVFDGYFRVTGAGGVVFDSIRIYEASGATVVVNEDGLQTGGAKPLHTYYGLDFGRLTTVRADDPLQYGETAALLVDGPAGH